MSLESSKSFYSFLRLPEDLILCVLEGLAPKELAQFAQTSKKGNEYANEVALKHIKKLSFTFGRVIGARFEEGCPLEGEGEVRALSLGRKSWRSCITRVENLDLKRVEDLVEIVKDQGGPWARYVNCIKILARIEQKLFYRSKARPIEFLENLLPDGSENTWDLNIERSKQLAQSREAVCEEILTAKNSFLGAIYTVNDALRETTLGPAIESMAGSIEELHYLQQQKSELDHNIAKLLGQVQSKFESRLNTISYDGLIRDERRMKEKEDAILISFFKHLAFLKDPQGEKLRHPEIFLSYENLEKNFKDHSERFAREIRKWMAENKEVLRDITTLRENPFPNFEEAVLLEDLLEEEESRLKTYLLNLPQQIQLEEEKELVEMSYGEVVTESPLGIQIPEEITLLEGLNNTEKAAILLQAFQYRLWGVISKLTLDLLRDDLVDDLGVDSPLPEFLSEKILENLKIFNEKKIFVPTSFLNSLFSYKNFRACLFEEDSHFPSTFIEAWLSSGLGLPFYNNERQDFLNLFLKYLPSGKKEEIFLQSRASQEIRDEIEEALLQTLVDQEEEKS